MGEFTKVRDFAADIQRTQNTVYRLIQQGVLEGIAGGRITTASGEAYKLSLRTSPRRHDTIYKAQAAGAAARRAKSASL